MDDRRLNKEYKRKYGLYDNKDIRMIIYYLKLIENDLAYSSKEELIELYCDLGMLKFNIEVISNDIDLQIKKIEKEGR